MADASKGPANRIAVVAMDGSEASEAALNCKLNARKNYLLCTIVIFCVRHTCTCHIGVETNVNIICHL